MTELSPIQALSSILRAANAEAVLVPERIALSTIYDLQYRVVVNSFVFAAFAAPSRGSAPRVRAAKQKLVQFVALRPWLLPVVRNWSSVQKSPQLSMRVSQRLRRGFLGDAMHENVIDFLVAAGAFERMDQYLERGTDAYRIDEWTASAVKMDLFSMERMTIEEMKSITITNDMLEGL